MSRRSVGLNERYPECLVEVNTDDAVNLGVKDGDKVRVISRRGEIEAKAKVGGRTDVGTIFIPFHFNEAAANRLTISALDPVAKIPEYKVCAVKLEKVA
jgi:predicted molibdopterin-dependent oxidoreductase YjgC